MQPTFRPDINALRAFAVLSVLGFHFGIPGFAGGFSGVDVFFVISGYLISSQILRALDGQRFSWAAFFTSRVRRIVPALVVVCSVCLLVGWFIEFPKEFVRLNRHVITALFFVSNLTFFGERGYFDNTAETKSLLHTWSLSVEAQFYLLLPVLLWVVHRFFRPYLRAIVFLLAVLGLSWTLYLNTQRPGDGFFLLSCRTWELLVGTLIANWQIPVRLTRWQWPLTGLSLAGLFLSTTVTSRAEDWPGIGTLVPVLSTALLIALNNAKLQGHVARAKPIQWIGDISYSLYLWHWPLWVFGRAYLSAHELTPDIVHILAISLASLVMAWLSWKYVEQPVRSLKQVWTSQRLVVAYLLVAISSFFWGVVVLKQKGFPGRFGPYVERAVKTASIKTPRDECFRDGNSEKLAKETFCRFGAPDVAPRFVLWGDSHANQYLEAVSNAASELKQAGLIATQSACSPMWIMDPSKAVSACERFNWEVFRKIESEPTIQTIVLGKWWNPGGDLNTIGPVIDNLLAKHYRVLILGPLPAPGFDVLDRWIRMQIREGNEIHDLSVSIASQQPQFDMVHQLQSRFDQAIHRGQLSLLSPLHTLCDAEKCWLVKDGLSNFRDDSHLSHSASLLFTDAIQRQLSRP